MENTSGFYKLVDEQLQYAPNGVMSTMYNLTKEEKDSYEFPIDDWYWFDDEDAAYAHFELVKPTEEIEEEVM